jgi:hypothetical protein
MKRAMGLNSSLFFVAKKRIIAIRWLTEKAMSAWQIDDVFRRPIVQRLLRTSQ